MASVGKRALFTSSGMRLTAWRGSFISGSVVCLIDIGATMERLQRYPGPNFVDQVP